MKTPAHCPGWESFKRSASRLCASVLNAEKKRKSFPTNSISRISVQDAVRRLIFRSVRWRVQPQARIPVRIADISTPPVTLHRLRSASGSFSAGCPGGGKAARAPPSVFFHRHCVYAIRSVHHAQSPQPGKEPLSVCSMRTTRWTGSPGEKRLFRRQQTEDKPIFLSIGYATCHWCHVMERESFEDEEVAELLNRYFVSIKVDREERPDVDHLYMTVCQALRGSGGWPLSIFMTPDRKPFFAGSYFPKSSRLGMPGFTDIILQLAHLWKNQRGKVLQAGEEITRALQPKKSSGQSERVVQFSQSSEQAYEQLRTRFDERWGGFGKAPKFPTPHHLTFLLRWHRRHPRVGSPCHG